MFHTGFLRLHIPSRLRHAPYRCAASANSKIRVFTQADLQRHYRALVPSQGAAENKTFLPKSHSECPARDTRLQLYRPNDGQMHGVTNRRHSPLSPPCGWGNRECQPGYRKAAP